MRKAGLIALGALHPRPALSSAPLIADDARVAAGIVARQKAVGLATGRLGASTALTGSEARISGPDQWHASGALAALAAELAPIAEQCRRRAEGVRQAAAEVKAIADR